MFVWMNVFLVHGRNADRSEILQREEVSANLKAILMSCMSALWKLGKNENIFYNRDPQQYLQQKILEQAIACSRIFVARK